MAGKGNWMAGAVKRPGAFRAKAKAHGESTQAYAKEVANDPRASTRTKRQAALARTFAKYRGGRKKGRAHSRKSR
ncbi:MAG TPA: hypothetical protein VNF73_01290 [Candidatus Saccharimonadales bacterium]|nr:hypothetical protein [Candidatus Saccharimonadales bacterium]